MKFSSNLIIVETINIKLYKLRQSFVSYAFKTNILFFIQLPFNEVEQLFNSSLGYTSMSWLMSFYNDFILDVNFLLVVLFVVIVKTTIIHTQKTISVSNIINYYVIILLILYIFSSIMLILSTEYSLTRIFPYFFLTSILSDKLFIGFMLFFIFYFLFFFEYSFRWRFNSSEILLLLILFIFFIKFLFVSNNFFMLYLCLEGLSYVIYLILLLCFTTNIEINEQNSKYVFIKYFIFNSISSLCILFGLVNINALVGSLQYTNVLAYIKNSQTFYTTSIFNFLYFSFLLVVIGFFFKLIFFPFFFWMLDIYENFPYFVFVLLNTFYKAAIFFTFIKIILQFCYVLFGDCLSFILGLFGIYSFFLGILGAIYSEKVRVFIFYTSVNQIGLFSIILSQLVTVSHVQLSLSKTVVYMNFNVNLIVSLIYYFIVYILSLFLFLLLIHCIWVRGIKYKQIEYFREIKNLCVNNLFLSLSLTIILFSFAGIPPLIGFFAKYSLFLNLFNCAPVLACVCITGSIFSAFYYLSIVNNIFFINIITFYKGNQQSVKLQATPLVFDFSKPKIVLFCTSFFCCIQLFIYWMPNLDFFIKIFCYNIYQFSFFIYYNYPKFNTNNLSINNHCIFYFS